MGVAVGQVADKNFDLDWNSLSKAGALGAVKALVARRGADSDIDGSTGLNDRKTLLTCACQRGFLEVAQYLVSVGASPNAAMVCVHCLPGPCNIHTRIHIYNSAPLYFASGVGHLEVVR